MGGVVGSLAAIAANRANNRNDEVEPEVCEFCGGEDGEHHDITTMERVWPNEPHVAPIGSQRCPATIPEPEYEPDDFMGSVY